MKNRELPLKTNRDIIRLVGERPLIEVFLDDVKCKCLWDTGSMISLISRNFLIKNLPNKKIYSVDEFLENEFLSLSAANNTEVPVEGVILIDFSIESQKFFQIPFLVTSENVANPIIGYNAIEYLVMNFENRLHSLLKMLPSLSVEIFNLRPYNGDLIRRMLYMIFLLSLTINVKAVFSGVFQRKGQMILALSML